jgi:hypothetical protein
MSRRENFRRGNLLNNCSSTFFSSADHRVGCARRPFKEQQLGDFTAMLASVDDDRSEAYLAATWTHMKRQSRDVNLGAQRSRSPHKYFMLSHLP